MTEPIVVVGGGIGGLTTALALHHHGQACEVHERAPELHEIGAGLGLWPPALRVFDRLGIGEEVRALGGGLSPSGIRNADGRWLVQFAEQDLVRAFGEAPIGVHRGELQAVLLRALPDGVVHTGHSFSGLDDRGRMLARFEGGIEVAGRGIVGADGNRSAVRTALFGPDELHDCSYVGWRGTTAWPEGVEPLDAAGEWWGRRERFGFLPIGGGRLTWYATARTFMSGGGPDEVRDRFSAWPEPVAGVVATTPDDQVWSDRIRDRWPLRRWSAGRSTLLGDAAHPMTPELGQGACQAIIDAWVLAEEAAATADIVSAFGRYERRRRRRTAFVSLAARAMAAGGNVEAPLAQRARERLTIALPRSAALAQFQMVVGR